MFLCSCLDLSLFVYEFVLGGQGSALDHTDHNQAFKMNNPLLGFA